MKTVAYLIIALLAISCLKKGENSYYIKTAGQIGITQADIPDSAIINQYVELKARTEQSNACWSHLNFKLTKKSDYEYSLDAFGVFESNGYCEDIKVYGDTTIAFKPEKTGKFVFKIAKSETVTESDTMYVKGVE
jgi:hypothetical protein